MVKKYSIPIFKVMNKKIIFKVDNEIIIESFNEMTIDEIMQTINCICLECSVSENRVVVDFEEFGQDMSFMEIGSTGLSDFMGNLISGVCVIDNLDNFLDSIAKKDYDVIQFY